MSGLRKAKEYDWKDSNMALFGSDVEKNIKKASAETEEAWNGSGEKVGTEVWRIEKFKVKHWPKEEYGNFFSGDSYIILHTYQPDPASPALAWDVHFWIGKHSTQDEYGTAAYKTVELDTFHNDGPVQHREVQGHESSLFKSYFDKMVYMEGGCASGFRHVEPAKYEPRLFIVKKTGRRTEIKQIPMRRKLVNSGDVFIMDLGMKIYQWNGSNCSKDEKYNAAAYCQQLESERGRAKTDVLEEDSCPETHEFYEKLIIEECDVEEEDVTDSQGNVKKIFKLSDASGNLNFELVAEGEISKDMLDTNDAFIVDTGRDVIVWVGGNASGAEKKSGLQYAHMYCTQSTNPLASLTVLTESQASSALEEAFAG
ncbi:gelsolin-like protein 2 isoform X2 [Watersipora subatra]|uniref:gelsolin-like protein 2 isoform X2 n=1 Tax=Watersipora subatra TaxID=2589382 RepID=UPI00355AEB04